MARSSKRSTVQLLTELYGLSSDSFNHTSITQDLGSDEGTDITITPAPLKILDDVT